MATKSSAIQKKIETLKKGLNNKFITAAQKEKIKSQVQKLESQAKASAPKKASKPATSSSLTRLQKLVKNKKYGVYKGAGVDLQKDSDRPAKAIGKRTSKSGKTYYEYRANRIDVKQPPKRYPKLEKGGYMAKGGVVGEYRVIPNKRGEGNLKMYVTSDYEKAFRVNGTLMEANEAAQKFVKENNETHPTATVSKIHPSGNPMKNKNVSYITKDEISKLEKGGKVGMAEWAVTITSEDGDSYDWDGFAKSEDDALDKAEKEAGFGSVESSVIMITDENGVKIEFAKGGYMAKGGKIENQYEGRNASDIWKNLDRGQRYHFIIDHEDVIQYAKDVKELPFLFQGQQSRLDWNKLDKDVKRAFEQHIRDGEYAKGGATKNMKSRRDLTIEEISSLTGLRKEGIEIFANDYELTDSDLSNIMQGIGRKMISKDDFSTAVVGNKNNSYAIEIVDFAKSGKGYKIEKGGYMAEGGVTEKEVVESNADMVLSQIKAVKHHAEELSNVVSRKSNIEAWVVGKIERASTDLSDITHYLEGNKDKMSMGGTVRYYAHKMDKK